MAANAPGVLGALFDAADTLNQLGALSTGIGFGLDSIYGPPPSDLKVAGTTVPVAHIGVTPPYVAAQACGFPGVGVAFAINATGSPIPDGAVMTPGTAVNRSGKPCLVGAGVYAVAAAVNMLQKTENFPDAYWSKHNATGTADTTTAPNGAATADSMTDDAVNTFHGFQRASGIVLTAGAVYTLSVFLKQGTGSRYANVAFDDNGANGVRATFDLQTGVISGALSSTGNATPVAAAMTDAGNGWYRCSVTGTASAAGTTGRANFMFSPSASGGSFPSYAGGGNVLFIWGAQLEQAAGPNPYVAVP